MIQAHTEQWKRLRISLCKAIGNWADKEADKQDNVECVGYWSDEVYGFMADAALAVLQASSEKEQWLINEGILKER